MAKMKWGVTARGATTQRMPRQPKTYVHAGAVADGVVHQPAAGKRVAVRGFTITLTAASTVTLFFDDDADSDNILFGPHPLDKGVVQFFPDSDTHVGAPDSVLKVKSTAGDIVVNKYGWEEP